MKGKVVHYNDLKYIGKIAGDDGESYFVHSSRIVERTPKRLFRGEEVEFEVIRNKRKPTDFFPAINIRPIYSDIDDEKSLLINPFLPDKPISNPRDFIGRKKQLVDCLASLQNKQSLLITGSRGIGKSSFSNQLFYISQGDQFLIKKHFIKLSKKLNFSPISVRLTKELRMYFSIGICRTNILRKKGK